MCPSSSSSSSFPINVSKCKVLHIGRSNPSNTYYVDVNNTDPLSVTTSEKDLGVIFDQGLDFDLQVCECINKANKLIGIMYRSFRYLDPDTFIVLYTSIIRPRLEYGNCIWSPLFKRQSVAIENVQRRATRLLPSLSDLPYSNRLGFLKLPSLKYRRLRGDLIQLYKIVHGCYNVDYRTFFNFSHVTSTRGDKFKIFIEGCSSNIRKNSFIYRTVKHWNSLNIQTKDSNSINGFKNGVDRELFHLMHDYDE